MQPLSKILVLSEDRELLNTVRTLPGCRVFTHDGGRTALSFIEETLPDIILLDVAPKETPGMELCRLIKSSRKLSSAVLVHVRAPVPSPPNLAAAPCPGADNFLDKPVSEQTLVVCIRAMLRVKGAEDKLRRCEQLWRTVFSRTRNAVLLVDEDMLIREANPRAAELYRCGQEDLTQKRLADLCPEPLREVFETRFRMIFRSHAIVLHIEQQTSSGEIFAAELQATHFRTGSRSYFEVMVWNVEEDPREEIEAREMSRANDFLAEYSSSSETAPVAASLYGGGLLSEFSPQAFAELVWIYDRVLDTGVEAQGYRVDSQLPGQLRELASRFGELRGGPRDVVEVHATVLKRKLTAASPGRKRAYNEEGRFLVLELMGYLAGFYRDRALASLAARGGR